jgi:membrane fusion protein (multidrug efflux system)
MRAGDSVGISVDAYPDRKVFGHVQSIQAGTGSRFSIIPAENATGNYVKVVQRVPVKIVLDGDVNSDTMQLLSPGMSVTPTVTVK